MYDMCKNTPAGTPAAVIPIRKINRACQAYSSGAFRSSSEQSLNATRKRNASMYDTSMYVVAAS